jgi:16S rRNA (adenine1518-N6/adenine1519-N6)-dimethyltransferase
LKKLITEEEIVKLNIDPTLRAESITLAEFARLSNVLVLNESPEKLDTDWGE